MNKKILNKLLIAAQKSSEKKYIKKSKTLIVELGAVTQLTLGMGGSQLERERRAWQPPD